MTVAVDEGRPIRLAFFIDSLAVGGSELNAIRTLEGLDRNRFDLSVFHFAASGPLLPRYEALRVPMVRVALSSFKHPSALLAGLRFMGELRHRRIEILHSHDIYSNIFSIPWARLARVPAVLASKRWLDDVPTRSYGAPDRTNVLVNRVASRMATRVLANSSAVARSLIDNDGVPASRIQVIPNFVGGEAFLEYPTDRRRALLGSLGIPEDARLIGVVARLAPVKAHSFLLRTLPALFARYPDLHVLLIGDGPSRAALAEESDSLGLGDRVHFTGTLPNIPNPHGLLDISVLPSLTEGFPNAVVEAMAAGRPVVATAVGGTPEAVVPGRTGFLVPSGNQTDLHDALVQLLESPELRRSFGSAGRERAREEYHVDAVLARLTGWYDGLARH